MPRRCVVVALVGGFVALVATAGRSQAPCGAVPYGSGAPGANAIVPDITITGLPLLGNAGFGYRVADVPGGAWTVHLLGIAPASTNLLGVEVLVDTPVVAGTFAASNGGAAFRLPLPSAPALTGLPLFAQTGALDPAAPQGISASAGLMVDLRRNNMLGAVSAYQGAAASDAFCAIHYLGNGRIIAGKRSSTASNRFLLSVDYGINWQVVGCPGSTGSHAYFFGADGATVFSGTGDTGNACLMRSDDSGGTWTVALTTAQIGAPHRQRGSQGRVRARGARQWRVAREHQELRLEQLRDPFDGQRPDVAVARGAAGRRTVVVGAADDPHGRRRVAVA